MKVWLDGEIVDGSEARIPVIDHGLLYGDGVFEGIRVYGRRVFRLEAHMARFSIAARAVHLSLPGGIEGVRDVVLETVRAFDQDEAYVRLIATRGDGELGVDPTTCKRPRLICIVDVARIYPAEKVAAGLDLVTSSLRRPPADVLDPRVKSLNYLNNALAKLEARHRNADDALLLNAHGMVSEASVANVFVLRGDRLLTPPTTDGALEGITRATVLDIARDVGLFPLEQTLGRFDLFAADEVFLTGTGAGIVPVRSLDGQPVGQGPHGQAYRKITEAFDATKVSLGTPF